MCAQGAGSQTIIQFNKETQSYKGCLKTELISSTPKVVRRLKDLGPVLYDASACESLDSELPLYTIYRDLCSNNNQQEALLDYGLRYDVTEMLPLMIGGEYVKTFGHDHLPWRGAWTHPEIFEIIEGEARFLVQHYRGEDVAEVSLVVACEGDVVLIPQSCGHLMINASSKRLITGNLISRCCTQTYERFAQRKGAAYFMLKGERLIRNENYPPLPQANTVEAEPRDIVERESGLLESFCKHPKLFGFLNEPEPR